jgi:hypothetical protein
MSRVARRCPWATHLAVAELAALRAAPSCSEHVGSLGLIEKTYGPESFSAGLDSSIRAFNWATNVHSSSPSATPSAYPATALFLPSVGSAFFPGLNQRPCLPTASEFESGGILMGVGWGSGLTHPTRSTKI